MTEGDPELEKALFDEFYASFEKGINALRMSSEPAAAEKWRQEAHALKGIALNLGADHLGALCKQAQEEYNVDPTAKSALLARIEHEYQAVQKFLKSVHA
jgi:HPt (histidine-containing phosphotransfer) domain-containing protein